MPARAEASTPRDVSELETSLSSVERAIATLGDTLCRPDITAIEAASNALHEAMRAAMNQFALVARSGRMPADLRARFAVANGRITAQREALIRASALVEQNLEVLIPRPAAQTSVYSANGAGGRGPGRMIASS